VTVNQRLNLLLSFSNNRFLKLSSEIMVRFGTKIYPVELNSHSQAAEAEGDKRFIQTGCCR